MGKTIQELYKQIDEFLLKTERIYIQPKKGEKPPKGAILQRGKKGGTFYESEETPPVQQVNEDTLRRQYAAYKTKLKGKLDDREKFFVENTLGELYKLNPDELKRYFQIQYSLKNKKSGDIEKGKFESSLKKYESKINIEKHTGIEKFSEIWPWIEKAIEVDKTKDYALLYHVVKELNNKFHIENDYLFKIRNWVYGGAKNLLSRGDSKLLDYASERLKYHFGSLDISDKNEVARFLMGNVYSEDKLLKKISYFKKYPEDTKKLYNLFILALKPIKDSELTGKEMSDYKYKLPIYNAFLKKDWDKAEKLVKNTKYGILR